MRNATLNATAVLCALAIPGLGGLHAQTRADGAADNLSGQTSPFDIGPLVSLRAAALESPLGQTVRTANGENGGRVVDVLTDPSGKVRAAVIEFGGFLGIGSRKVAVAWNAVRFQPGSRDGGVVVDVTPEQLRTAPEYKGGAPSIVTQPSDSAY